MSWIKIKFPAQKQNAEAFSDLLMEYGAVSVTYTDPEDQPIFEPLPGEIKLWEQIDITGIFESCIEPLLIVALLKNSELVKGEFNYQIEIVEDKDWHTEWLENYHPLKITDHLWICPSWKTPPQTDAVNIMLDPGLAFGTGTHPTTALCLQWLDSINLKDKVIVDFGCGSGILAVAALKLGAKSAIGVDIDPQALEASEANAIKNNVNNRLSLYLAEDLPKDINADIILANILAGPLRGLYPEFLKILSKHGQLCLSGILEEQVDSVIEVYAETFFIENVEIMEQWARVTAKK